MLDYEYLFSTALSSKLKERIQGRIYVEVIWDDVLIVKIKRQDGNNFKYRFENFSKRVLNGFTTDYAAYEVENEYRRFVLKQFFK